jgi:cytochrome c oxidase cbb3-type subunit III
MKSKTLIRRVYKAGAAFTMIIAALGIPFGAFAEPNGYTGRYDISKLGALSENDQMLVYTLGLMVVTSILVFIAAIYVYRVLKISFKTKEELEAEAAGLTSSESEMWINFKKKWITGDLLPVGQEKDIMLDHAYDGIVELDNHMPPWLRNVFFICIIWAFGYAIYFLVLEIGMNPTQEYYQELAIAEEKAETRRLLATNSIDGNLYGKLCCMSQK